MSRIRGKDTTPEKIVRSMLHQLGYRFRLHVRIPVAPVYDRRLSEQADGAHRAPLQRRTAAVSKTSRSANKDKRRSNAAKTLGSIAAAAVGAGAHSRAPRAVSVDILLPKHKTAIFVHGCFWHRHSGCKNCTTPTNRREWWLAKLNGNAARDKVHQAALQRLGWHVIVIWECEAKREKFFHILRRRLPRRSTQRELTAMS